MSCIMLCFIQQALDFNSEPFYVKLWHSCHCNQAFQITAIHLKMEALHVHGCQTRCMSLHTLKSTSFVDTGSYCLMTHTVHNRHLYWTMSHRSKCLFFNTMWVLYIFLNQEAAFVLTPTLNHPLTAQRLCFDSLQGIVAKRLLYKR